MLVQKFIRNNGDWRIGVYGHVARWAIYRQNSGASHLNNTSAGGVATNISINKVPLKVRQLAEKPRQTHVIWQYLELMSLKI